MSDYRKFDAALQSAGVCYKTDEPMSAHTSFKIGGPAAFWCTPRDAEQLRRTLQLCRENDVRVYLLGNGSNTLFDDAGFDGAVIDMRGLSGMENSGLDTDAVRITDGAGTLTCGGETVKVKKGESYFIPAGSGKYAVTGDCETLVTVV